MIRDGGLFIENIILKSGHLCGLDLVFDLQTVDLVFLVTNLNFLFLYLLVQLGNFVVHFFPGSFQQIYLDYEILDSAIKRPALILKIFELVDIENVLIR